MLVDYCLIDLSSYFHQAEALFFLRMAWLCTSLSLHSKLEKQMEPDSIALASPPAVARHPAPAALLRLVVRGARRQIPAARRNLATSHCPAQILEDLGDRLVSGAVWQFQACHLERLFGLGKSMFSRLG